MSSSCVDSGASSPPPLSSTRSGSAATALNSAAAAAGMTSALPLRAVHTPQQQQQQQQPQCGDSTCLVSLPTSSGGEGHVNNVGCYTEGLRASDVTGHTALNRRDNAHWGARPSNPASSPTPLSTPDRQATVMAAAATAAAEYDSTTAAALPQLQPLPTEREVATISKGHLSNGSADATDSRASMTLRDGARNALQDTTAAAGDSMAGASASYHVLLQPAGVCSAGGKDEADGPGAAFRSTSVSPSPPNTTVSPTPPPPSQRQQQQQQQQQQPLPSPVRSLLPVSTTSVGSSHASSRKSASSTPVVGAWMPYTPPGPEPDASHPREDSGAAARAAALRGTQTASSTTSDVNSAPPSMTQRVYASPGPASSPLTQTSVREESSSFVPHGGNAPLVFTLTPSVADEGGSVQTHEVAPVANTHVDPAAAAVGEDAGEEEAPRRAKRRPPSLFVTAAVPAAAAATATANSNAAATASLANSLSLSHGISPPLLSSAKAGGGGATAATTKVKLLQRQGTGFSLNGPGSTTTAMTIPTSTNTAASGLEGSAESAPLLEMQHASPPGNTAQPTPASPSPSSTGMFTLVSTTNGEEEEDEEDDEEEDRGVGRVALPVAASALAERDGGDAGHRAHRQFAQETSRQLPPPQQQQQQKPVRGPQISGMASFSPPRPSRGAATAATATGTGTPPSSAAMTFARRDSGAGNANSLSNSLTSHSILLAGSHGMVANVASPESGGVASVPTASLHYGSSRAGSTTAVHSSSGAHVGASRPPIFGFSPSSASFGPTAAHYVAGNGVAEVSGRAASGGTPSHTPFASPAAAPAAFIGNLRGTRPPPLALAPLPAPVSTSHPTPSIAGMSTSAPADALVAAAAGASSSTTSSGPTSTLPAPVPLVSTRRRAAPPPSLFKARSPVTENSGTEAATSPKSTEPSSTLRRVSTASSGHLSTPPLNARVPVALLGAGALRGIGGASSTITTPNLNTNGSQVGLGSSIPQRPQSVTNVGGGANHGSGSSSSGVLVRLSHDRRTLIAGLFRVSRDGCLTVRNMLLLNPTRIDAAATPSGNGLHGSPFTGEARRPVQLLHPQRAGGINYSPVSSNSGAAGRMLMPHTGQGPVTPNTAGSDWCSPQMYGGGGGNSGAGFVGGGGGGGGNGIGSVGFGRPGLGNSHRSHHNAGYDPTTTNPNASFTLFSTSMDTPFSPITYSLDSQRLTFPNSSGYHLERGSSAAALAGGGAAPSVPQLLRAAREDHPAGGSSTAFGAGAVVHHDVTPTTSTTQYLGVGNVGSGTGGPSFTAHSRAGGAGNSSLYRAQLRRQASVNWMSTTQTTGNAASPTALQTTGSAGSLFGPAGFAGPDVANSLLMPYADIPAWRNGVMGVAPPPTAASAAAIPSNTTFVGSPANHLMPGLGSSAGFTTTLTSGMGASGTAQPHGSTTSQLPPNVVRLRDLDILSNSVGEGASATVFVAIHKPTGRRLAVKRVDLSPLCLGCASPYLRKGAIGNGRIKQLQQIVIRELQVLHLTYRSPFMVKVYNAFFLSESAALDIVMEFMHYGSLDHLTSALQTHARELRESQQQRHRLLFGDDEAGPLGSPGSGSDRVLTSPLPLSDGLQHAHYTHHGYPHIRSPLEHAMEVEARVVRAGSLPGPSGSTHDHSSGGGGVSSHLSPKMLNFGRGIDQQQVQLRGRRLSLAAAVAGGGGGGAAHDASLLPSVTSPGGNDDDDVDSLQPDTFSVKSNCGTDDTELDDGSGLMEEPFGVTERLVAVVGEQLLRGVRDMHSRGYIHRDIKPGNVLVNEHGVVKLSDFGLSQRCDDTGTGIKNPAMLYIPPPSTAPTRTNTPLHSPPPSALLVSNNNNNNGVGGNSSSSLAHRQQANTFSPYSPRPLATSEHVAHHPLCVGVTSPEMDSSPDGLMLSSSTTNSLAAQRHGMDVLEAESTSSEEGAENSSSAGRGGGGARDPSSSSSSDAGGNCSGTDKYMSPERQRGEAHGKPADIWAVGVTLAEFAVGEYPYNVDDIIDEFDRVSRLEAPVDVLHYNKHRAAPLSTVFADFIHLATLPIASQRPTAQELLEHPFFKQWHKPFNLKDYLAARVSVPSNKMKSDYLEQHRLESQA